MKKILCTLLLLIAIFLASVCQASEASKAKYINDNYFVTAISIFKDFGIKGDNIIKTYPENAKDIAVADLALYTKPRFDELRNKLQNDDKVKNPYLAQIVDGYIVDIIELLDKFTRLKDKSSLNEKMWKQDIVNQSKKVKTQHDKFLNAFNEAQVQK